MVRNLLRFRARSGRSGAAQLVATLPPYQVAFWPDGWDLEPDGGVLVWDTHAMAEARRWYSLADRNRSREDGRRVMSLLGIYVPRAIVDLSNRRFTNEQVASVAVQMVAGDWVAERRRGLLADPEHTLGVRSRYWRGSRHKPGMKLESVAELVESLIRIGIEERLIPDVGYRVRVYPEVGYGIIGYRCVLEVGLDRYAAQRVLEVLATALVPWNRAIARGGATALLIEVEMEIGRRAGKN